MAVNGSHIKAAMDITKIVLAFHKITSVPAVSTLQPIAKAAAELLADYPSDVTTIADQVMWRIISGRENG